MPADDQRLLAAGGAWHSADFLIDTGADRTLLRADVAIMLGLPAVQPEYQIEGAGGLVAAGMLRSQLRLTRDDSGHVHFRSTFMVSLDAEQLDMSILGRDILDLFAVIIDRPGDVVCLLRDRHRYRIEPE